MTAPYSRFSITTRNTWLKSGSPIEDVGLGRTGARRSRFQSTGPVGSGGPPPRLARAGTGGRWAATTKAAGAASRRPAPSAIRAFLRDILRKIDLHRRSLRSPAGPEVA